MDIDEPMRGRSLSRSPTPRGRSPSGMSEGDRTARRSPPHRSPSRSRSRSPRRSLSPVRGERSYRGASPRRYDRYSDRGDRSDRYGGDRYGDRGDRYGGDRYGGRGDRYSDRADRWGRGDRYGSRRDDRRDDGTKSAPPSKPRSAPQNVEPNDVVGVFGLSLMTTERELQEKFESIAPVAKTSMVYDARSGRSRGFAFITMESIEGAQQVVNELNGFVLNGRAMRVDFSSTRKPHEPTPGEYRGITRDAPPGGWNYRGPVASRTSRRPLAPPPTGGRGGGGSGGAGFYRSQARSWGGSNRDDWRDRRSRDRDLDALDRDERRPSPPLRRRASRSPSPRRSPPPREDSPRRFRSQSYEGATTPPQGW